MHDEVAEPVSKCLFLVETFPQDMYPDPYAFKPERFLIDGKPNPAVKDPDAAFGFGRR